MATQKDFTVGTKVVAHKDGTGSMLDAKDGRRLKGIPEAEMRVIFGDAIIDSVKQAGRLPVGTVGSLTVTEVDRDAGIVTVSGKRKE